MKRKWSNRSLGNLKGIHPDLRRVMDRALQSSPLDFIVIEGLRSKGARSSCLTKVQAAR
jgi:peptidoglycan LD-endopeptidase CwlK